MPLPRRLQRVDEEVLVDVRPHWVFFFGPAAATAGAATLSLAVVVEWASAPIALAWLLTAAVLVPAGWLLLRLMRWALTGLVVTTHRIVVRRGPGRRRTSEVQMREVRTVQLQRSLLERLIGCGSLVIGLRDGSTWVLSDLPRPATVQATIHRYLGLLSSPPPVVLRQGAARASAPRRGTGVV